MKCEVALGFCEDLGGSGVAGKTRDFEQKISAAWASILPNLLELQKPQATYALSLRSIIQPMCRTSLGMKANILLLIIFS